MQSTLQSVPLQLPPRLAMAGMHSHKKGRARYRIMGLWCLHFYRYSGELKVNGASFPYERNSFSITPPDAVLEYRYDMTPSVHAVAHFELAPAGSEVLLPPMFQLDQDFEPLCSALEEVSHWLPKQPERASARCWDLLWRLSSLVATERTGTESAERKEIESALRIIELNLHESISIPKLADSVGLSHNHFTRIFSEVLGTTPLKFIHRRRSERASHLLRHSDLRIKLIAGQIGVPDLQAFNKLIKREFGKSPRQLRDDGQKANR